MDKSFRRQWLIDRQFQWRFILVLLLIGLLNFAFYLVTLQALTGELEQTLLADGRLPGAEVSDFIREQKAFLFKGAMFGFLLQSVLLFLIGLYFSHRISGPLHRINVVLQGIARGEETKLIQLRRHDFMRELSANINETIVLYDQFRREIAAELEKLSLDTTMGAEEKKQLRDLLARLKDASPLSAG